ncbi:MAG: beta-lactamase family protein [Acidobacteria bacterium]|nr:beta-lactamase family protein [Acidobacteriota bacterium]
MFSLSPAGHAQTLDKAKLDQLFDRLLEKNKAMGSLTLARDGNVLYSRSFGYSHIDGSERKPLTAQTKFRIGSITKTYTAVMIFQLVEEGKLRLTDTLDKFFPQIPNASRITIAHILNHRSGIADIEHDGAWGKQARTRDEVVARIAQGKPNFEPDARHQYSNAGYILLGQIVEKVGGKPYQEALKQRITAKIGLRDTYLGSSNTDPGRNEALSYRYLGNWRESPEIDFSITGGAGSILSTPLDMTKFIQALFEGKLISPQSLSQMKTMRDGEGMGMEPFTFAGKTLYGHTGGSSTSGAWLAYFPEEKLALAYTTNAKIYPVRDIVAGVFDIAWNRPFQVPTFDAFTVSPEVLDRYVGVYTIAGTPARMTVTRDGAALYIKAGAESSGVPLEATAEHIFRINPGVTFEFDVAKGQLTIKRPNGERVFTKEK